MHNHLPEPESLKVSIVSIYFCRRIAVCLTFDMQCNTRSFRYYAPFRVKSLILLLFLC